MELPCSLGNVNMDELYFTIKLKPSKDQLHIDISQNILSALYIMRHHQQIVQRAFCDWSHNIYEYVTNVS